VKELSSTRQEFAVADEVRETSAPAVPGACVSTNVAGIQPEECWIEIEGARMRYLHAGSGPPIILVHGLLGYAFSWRYAMPALAPYATVYALDMLGAGFSERASGIKHNMRAAARRILKFAEQLGLTSFDLLGTSHGGAVAMMAAEECLNQQSEIKIRRLILVAPVNPYSAHGRKLAPFFGSRFGANLYRLTIAHMNFLFPYFHSRMYGDRNRIPPGTLEGYTAPLAVPGLFEHALSIVSTWTQDLRELQATLPKLASIPTLLMWGEKDTAVYASSAAPLAKFFPKSQLVVFPGIGHLPYEECADEFNRELIKFLSRQDFDQDISKRETPSNIPS
jgi:pimeloyl-ACP methyl ester carboxylesterase